MPRAHLVICGSRPSRAVRALAARAGVIVTGRVPDVRPYLEAAEVFVAPLRIARGIQNKVLEAMAMGLPVVACRRLGGNGDHARRGHRGCRRCGGLRRACPAPAARRDLPRFQWARPPARSNATTLGHTDADPRPRHCARARRCDPAKTALSVLCSEHFEDGMNLIAGKFPCYPTGRIRSPISKSSQVSRSVASMATRAITGHNFPTGSRSGSAAKSGVL